MIELILEQSAILEVSKGFQNQPQIRPLQHPLQVSGSITEEGMDAVKHCPLDRTWLLHLRTHSSYGNLNKMELINIPLQMEEGLRSPIFSEVVLAVDG